jgi:histidine triad (HIT) family protein
MKDCIFCKIVRGEIPSNVVFENDDVLAFEDINPMAPVHVVVIPKKHIATLMDVTGDEMGTMGSIISAVQEVAKIKGIDEKGFRMVVNCNEEGGQLVFHLHIHVLGGKRLRDELD